ncbi:MAG: hypothetical protein ACM3Q2_09245, partial [Syntrophothermus sp.]
MKIFNLILILAAVTGCLSSEVNASDSKNPFLRKEWKTPFQTPPFKEIKIKHYLPAIEEGIKQQKAEIEAIVNNAETPTFNNTIEALEKSGYLLSRTNKVFGAMNSACTGDEMQKVSEKIIELTSSHSNDIYLNDKLFSRIKSVYDNKEKLNLTDEQKTVLENYYLDFTSGGANLTPEGKEKLRNINNELAQLVQKFGDNVRKENARFELTIDRKE